MRKAAWLETKNENGKGEPLMGIRTFFDRLFGRTKDLADGGSPAAGRANGNGHGTQMACVDCKRTFLFEEGEQKFFKMRGLTPPKRCPGCRMKRKHRR